MVLEVKVVALEVVVAVYYYLLFLEQFYFGGQIQESNREEGSEQFADHLLPVSLSHNATLSVCAIMSRMFRS